MLIMIQWIVDEGKEEKYKMVKNTVIQWYLNLCNFFPYFINLC